MRRLFIYFLLFYQTFGNPIKNGWLFNYDQSNVCNIFLQSKQIFVNLTNIYGLGSVEKVKIPNTPHYCSPQACLDFNGFSFICLNYTTFDFMHIKNAEQVENLNLNARLLRYNAQTKQIVVWNGQHLKFYKSNKTHLLSSLQKRIKLDLPPFFQINDFHVFKNKTFILSNAKMYLLNEESGRLFPFMIINSNIFPFQFISNSTPSTVQSDQKKMSENTTQIFSQLLFPLLSFIEFGILIVLAYYFKWKVYKGRDGRLQINPNASNSEGSAEEMHAIYKSPNTLTS